MVILLSVMVVFLIIVIFKMHAEMIELQIKLENYRMRNKDLLRKIKTLEFERFYYGK
jgi:hypothetical protein